MTDDVEHLFMCLLASCIFLLCPSLLPHILNWAVYLFVIETRGYYLCILDIGALFNVNKGLFIYLGYRFLVQCMHEHIFSSCVACLLILLLYFLIASFNILVKRFGVQHWGCWILTSFLRDVVNFQL